VIPQAKTDAALRTLQKAGEKPWIIGEVTAQRRGKARVEYF
jgi:hypothetical protein